MTTPPTSAVPPPLRTDESLDEWLPAFTTEDPEDTRSQPVPSIQSTPIRNRAQFAWTQQRYILENIKLADAKAGFVITVASATLSALFANGKLTSPASTFEGFIIALLTTIGVIAQVVAISFGAWTIKPRVASRNKPSPTSWTDIARYPTLAAFKADSLTLTEEEATEDLTEQVFYLSAICHRKHLLISRAILSATIGGLALIFELVLLHLVYG